jgi:hypothetical protein
MAKIRAKRKRAVLEVGKNLEMINEFAEWFPCFTACLGVMALMSKLSEACTRTKTVW